MQNLNFKNMRTHCFGSRHHGSVSVILTILTVVATATLAYAQSNPLDVSGDFRLRYERTTRQEPGGRPDIMDPRNREVVRFRVGLSKNVNEMLKLGARLATGSLDDPNTADVTLGDFVNDLEVNLDRVYLEFTHQNLFVTGGKFGNPFMTTDLVWDGDVNPQGLAASYTVPTSGKITPKFIGIYSIVDEQTINPDSYMLGGQAQLGIKSSPDLNLTLAGAYYNYAIQSLVDADGGDTRSNHLNATGTDYLSDFNLLNFTAVVDYRSSERFPLRFVGDYVKNNGAAGDDDTGFAFDVYLGRASKKNDWRFQYGYSQTETDAVLAAFSHDNTTIATNYKAHTLAVDFAALDNTVLNLTLYIYKRNDVPAGEENDFFSRLRLNTVVKF